MTGGLAVGDLFVSNPMLQDVNELETTAKKFPSLLKEVKNLASKKLEIAAEGAGKDGLQHFITDPLYSFFSDRLKVMLKDQGIRHDIISAVLANGDDDFVRVVARAKALQEFLGTENGANLLGGYKRASRLVTDEEKKDKTTYTTDKLNTSILEVQEEKMLSMQMGITHSALEQNLSEEDYEEAMQELSTLRLAVDSFFDKVMVNCDKPELRKERLHLLARLRDLMNQIADFSQIEG